MLLAIGAATVSACGIFLGLESHELSIPADAGGDGESADDGPSTGTFCSFVGTPSITCDDFDGPGDGPKANRVSDGDGAFALDARTWTTSPRSLEVSARSGFYRFEIKDTPFASVSPRSIDNGVACTFDYRVSAPSEGTEAVLLAFDLRVDASRSFRVELAVTPGTTARAWGRTRNRVDGTVTNLLSTAAATNGWSHVELIFDRQTARTTLRHDSIPLVDAVAFGIGAADGYSMGLSYGIVERIPSQLTAHFDTFRCIAF